MGNTQPLAGAAHLFAGAAQYLLELCQNGSPLGSGSAAKSSGWKRSSIWQILCRDRPGTTSDRMARSVSTSFGIISRSAVARSLGKYVYLQAQQPGRHSCIDALMQAGKVPQQCRLEGACSPAGPCVVSVTALPIAKGVSGLLYHKLRTGCTANNLKGPRGHPNKLIT